MKRFAVLSLLALLAGCTQAPYRSGNIVIHKFDTEGFKTSNPAAIDSRVVTDVREALHKELLHYTKQDSQLRIAETCSPGNYELKGKITEVSTEIDHQYRFVLVKTRSRFKVDIEAALFRCGTVAPDIEISTDELDENMIDLVEHLAEDIVKEFRYDRTKPPIAAN